MLTINKLEKRISQSIESKKLTDQIIDFCLSQKIVNCKSFNIDNLTFGDNIHILIEPSTELNKFHGMQINYFKHSANLFGSYEVSEYQAGKKENELHIFSDNETLKDALICLNKGNKRSKKEIKKIYK